MGRAKRSGVFLELWSGDRKGQHSIRVKSKRDRKAVDDQWRICFVWRDGHCYDVEILDYH